MTESNQNGLSPQTTVGRNVLWNLACEVAPVLGAVVSIALLLRGVGTKRLGVLSFARTLAVISIYSTSGSAGRRIKLAAADWNTVSNYLPRRLLIQ